MVDGARVEARRLIIRDDGGSDWHKGSKESRMTESFALGSWVDAATETGKD